MPHATLASLRTHMTRRETFDAWMATAEGETTLLAALPDLDDATLSRLADSHMLSSRVVQAILARWPSEDVRRRLAHLRTASDDVMVAVLEQLIDDPSSSVRDAAFTSFAPHFARLLTRPGYGRRLTAWFTRALFADMNRIPDAARLRLLGALAVLPGPISPSAIASNLGGLLGVDKPDHARLWVLEPDAGADRLAALLLWLDAYSGALRGPTLPLLRAHLAVRPMDLADVPASLTALLALPDVTPAGRDHLLHLLTNAGTIAAAACAP